MQLRNEQLTITTTKQGAVTSLKFFEHETLYQGIGVWKKTFAVMFPSLGYSTGFVVAGHNYAMPKHGFWNQLSFVSFYQNETLVAEALLDDKQRFPQKLKIRQEIALQGRTVFFKYSFTNLTTQTAFFQFGLHPAFQIDATARLQYQSTTKQTAQLINLEGIETRQKVVVNHQLIQKFAFAQNYDTLIFPNSDFKTITLQQTNYQMQLKFDAPHLQLWKNQDNTFICIEPWYGKSDATINAPIEANKKPNINIIQNQATKTFVLALTFQANI